MSKRKVLVTVEITLEHDAELLPEHVPQLLRVVLESAPLRDVGVAGIAVAPEAPVIQYSWRMM